LEEIEPLHKEGNEKCALAMVDSCEYLVANEPTEIPELNANTISTSLFDRESKWGGNPKGFWKLVACTAVRCEHSIRLLQIRELDLFNDENLLIQVEAVYSPEELRGSHG
jgi:hypothetical protein